MTPKEILEACPDRTVAIDRDGDSWQKIGGFWWSSDRGASPDPWDDDELLAWCPVTIVWMKLEERFGSDRCPRHSEVKP